MNETPKSDPEQLELFPEAKPIEEVPVYQPADTVKPYRFCSDCGSPLEGIAHYTCLYPARHSRPF